MRLIFVLLALCAICYILLLGVPNSPGEIQFARFFQCLKIEVKELIEQFSLMKNPLVKLILISGAAYILVGFIRQPVK